MKASCANTRQNPEWLGIDKVLVLSLILARVSTERALKIADLRSTLYPLSSHVGITHRRGYVVIGIGHKHAKEECEKIFRFQIKGYKLGLVWKSEENFNIIAYNECKCNFPRLGSVCCCVSWLAGWLGCVGTGTVHSVTPLERRFDDGVQYS